MVDLELLLCEKPHHHPGPDPQGRGMATVWMEAHLACANTVSLECQKPPWEAPEGDSHLSQQKPELSSFAATVTISQATSHSHGALTIIH